MQMQGQAYALGVDQQTAMNLAASYGSPVNAGDSGVLLDPQGAPLGTPLILLSILAYLSCPPPRLSRT